MDKTLIRRLTLDPQAPFDFSQASLQDYVDCARRFQLRYLQKLRWPAPQSEPLRENEAHIRRGERFHRMAQQALAGIPTERLARMAAADPDPALARWWNHFTLLLPSLLEGYHAAEVMLAAALGKHRLLAKYDLLQALPDGKVRIYDWKTSLAHPRRSSLEARLQTRIYPTLLARAGTAFNQGRAIQASQIEMIYWFSEFPDRPERFTFTSERLEREWRGLEELTAEISTLPQNGFDLTTEEKRCRYCVYRSLCARGKEAGPLAELDVDLEADSIQIDFEQIGEIYF